MHPVLHGIPLEAVSTTLNIIHVEFLPILTKLFILHDKLNQDSNHPVDVSKDTGDIESRTESRKNNCLNQPTVGYFIN